MVRNAKFSFGPTAYPCLCWGQNQAHVHRGELFKIPTANPKYTLVLGRFFAEAARVSWSFPLCSFVDRHEVWYGDLVTSTIRFTSGLKEMSGYLPLDVSVASYRWASSSVRCLQQCHLLLWSYSLIAVWLFLTSQVTMVEIASCVILSCYTTEFDGPLTCTRLFRWHFKK